MMEQPQVGVCQNDSVLVAGLNNNGIVVGTSRAADVAHSALKVGIVSAITPSSKVNRAYQFGPVNVVSEREESVGAESDARQFREPFAAFGVGEEGRNLFEVSLELIARHVFADGSEDEVVDGVRFVCAFHSGLELEVEDTRVLAEPPVVGLVAGQASAVDARLLASADSDHLSVASIAN